MTTTSLNGSHGAACQPGVNGNGHASGKTFTYTEFDPDGNEIKTIVTDQPAGRNQLTGTRLLIVASVLLVLLAAAQGAVSWAAQYHFVLAAKHIGWASAFEAFGLDLGAVIFALLGLARAMQGRSAKVERILNACCAGGSILMNILAGQLGSPRSVIVYALPSLLYLACSDRLIAVVASHALKPSDHDRSAWRYAGTGALYTLRLVLAPPSTAKGLRRMALNAAPLPGPVAGEAELPAGDTLAIEASASKTSRLLQLYKAHEGYLIRDRVARIATDLAPLVDLQPGSAKTALYRHLRDLGVQS